MDKNFRGNAYIVKDSEVLLNYSGGFADLANEIPNTIDTRFACASMSKTFVAVGILQLIEAGKLGFQDTIGAILDFDLKNIDPLVTVRQLLNHTSGVPDYFDESVMDDYEALWTVYPNYRIRKNSDMFPLFIDKPMIYGKGGKFQYNNSGYVLLASIIEKISGMDFDGINGYGVNIGMKNPIDGE
ncbi:MAG: beta-lactamase family protein [Clostridiales bacterium]|nr:beta-lactamase family protein [Clostridiales bacterium]